jgi:hypothetical protein
MMSERPTGGTDAGLWPTPTQDSATERRKRYAQGGMPLTAAVAMWPTPKANDAKKGGNFDVTNPRNGLPAAVKSLANSADTDSTLIFSENTAAQTAKAKVWPTPTVNDSKNCTLPRSQINHDNIPGALLRDGEASGGQLNPTWVEWLMGWPLGWTDLKRLETDRCHSAPPQPGASLQTALNDA